MTGRMPAVFVDRDGTLLEEVGYLDRLERLALFPYSVDAVRLLNRAGFRVVVITNQAGVARGFFGEGFVREAHEFLDRTFRAGQARIDGFYYCPRLPEAAARHDQGCGARPRPRHPGFVRSRRPVAGRRARTRGRRPNGARADRLRPHGGVASAGGGSGRRGDRQPDGRGDVDPAPRRHTTGWVKDGPDRDRTGAGRAGPRRAGG